MLVLGFKALPFTELRVDHCLSGRDICLECWLRSPPRDAAKPFRMGLGRNC
jgi:hypothetical protein